ncbi:MAG: hypothetical protein AUI36_35690 [Cyanobacteria bacterium 13_1_40CM_2_61_4]|nr:MAG: hypothetical protein AUI36_35690 [Cyanobacteria bacterium 13_1_40CM_2_61_4]
MSQPKMIQTFSRWSSTSRTRLWNFYHRKRFELNMKSLRIKERLPIPTDYSITADFANIMIRAILKRKPNLIVEAGCGLSTIVAAYCLKKLGRGYLVSLEHQRDYLELCQRFILQHGLQRHVGIVHAPLTRYGIGDGEWLWYELRFKERLTKIDMLIVDGPPGDLQPLARYPALPLLIDLFSEACFILMDDGARWEEQEIVERWKQEYGFFNARYISSPKGVICLKRR